MTEFHPAQYRDGVIPCNGGRLPVPGLAGGRRPCWAGLGWAGLGWAGLRFSAFYLQHNSETFFEHSSRHRHFELLGKDMEIKWDE